MAVNDGGSAFPKYFGGNRDLAHGEEPGMSLRDYFAAKTVAALADTVNDERGIEIIAIRAYRIADALLKAREQS